MSSAKASLGFHKDSDGNLNGTAHSILTGMTGNANFPDPPVALSELEAAIQVFEDARAQMANGGRAASAHKTQCREVLIGLLYKLGCYVNIAAGGDLAVLLSSGFRAKHTNRAPHPLATPILITVTNAGEGRLVLRAARVPNARAYEVRYASEEEGPPAWRSLLFTQARSMPLADLIPGQRYVMQARAIGGSTVYSQWTDPTTHRTL